MEHFDPISIIEAAYRLDSTQREWMSGLVRQLMPTWNEGHGVGMFEVRIDDQGRPDIGEMVYHGEMGDEFSRIVRAMNRSLGQREVEVSYAPNFVFSTLSQRMKPIRDDFREDPVYIEYAHPLGIYDCMAAQIFDPSGTQYILAAPLSEIRTPSVAERRIWARVVAHMAAADRLRRDAPKSGLALDFADAVLDPVGKLLHLESCDAPDGHRNGLERAAEAIGRARGRMRHSQPYEALEIWTALVDGRYSLVEYEDTDGKCYMLARRNEPCAAEPAALDPRERQAVQYAVMGHSDALIAYELGLPVAEVSAIIQRALVKLSLDSRDQLVRFWQMLQADTEMPQ